MIRSGRQGSTRHRRSRRRCPRRRKRRHRNCCCWSDRRTEKNIRQVVFEDAVRSCRADDVFVVVTEVEEFTLLQRCPKQLKLTVVNVAEIGVRRDVEAGDLNFVVGDAVRHRVVAEVDADGLNRSCVEVVSAVNETDPFDRYAVGRGGASRKSPPCLFTIEATWRLRLPDASASETTGRVTPRTEALRRPLRPARRG